MINIASSQPVQWTPAPTPSVAVVAPVAPVQRTQGESHSGFSSQKDPRSGAETEKRAGQNKALPAETQAAPLLPREQAEEVSKTPEGQSDESALEAADSAEAIEADATEKALKFLEVLANVWKASAAVVEEALRLDEAQATAGIKSADALGAVGPSQRLNAATALEQVEQADSGVLRGLPAGDPVAYTEQGTSEWAPLEPGQLVHKKA